MKAYRYKIGNYCSVDEFERVTSGRIELKLHVYNVVGITPKGYWIELPLGGRKFVLNEGKNLFARRDKGRALLDIKARKERYISILKAKIDETNIALRSINAEIEAQKVLI